MHPIFQKKIGSVIEKMTVSENPKNQHEAVETSDLELAAKDLLDAIEFKSSAGIAEAFEAMFMCCDNDSGAKNRLFESRDSDE